MKLFQTKAAADCWCCWCCWCCWRKAAPSASPRVNASAARERRTPRSVRCAAGGFAPPCPRRRRIPPTVVDQGARALSSPYACQKQASANSSRVLRLRLKKNDAPARGAMPQAPLPRRLSIPGPPSPSTKTMIAAATSVGTFCGRYDEVIRPRLLFILRTAPEQ